MHKIVVLQLDVHEADDTDSFSFKLMEKLTVQNSEKWYL
jgi:hypothetical protein